MKFGVLFSGGKDSTFALHLMTEKKHQIVCLITVISKNKESYMFHTPNVDITVLQAQALGLPLISVDTDGCKEAELADLEVAILQAKDRFGIEGVVTGAVESTYQTSRIQRICDKLCLECFNPLWMYNQRGLLEELLERNFQVIISGVFAYPLSESWLGKQLDYGVIEQLSILSEKYGLSITGEGGEIETTVLDAPMFKQKIEIVQSEAIWSNTSGVFVIKNAKLVPK
ncbi:MAG: diphthine--ammonia ligase [Nitrososphaerota archaeon]|jgi:ABC transporter with metal-binding/Fe-S-binding domain ATP-binding protein|nr:diphthine--ammonia ligase [Nitrososphaerota archaeon]